MWLAMGLGGPVPAWIVEDVLGFGIFPSSGIAHHFAESFTFTHWREPFTFTH